MCVVSALPAQPCHYQVAEQDGAAISGLLSCLATVSKDNGGRRRVGRAAELK